MPGTPANEKSGIWNDSRFLWAVTVLYAAGIFMLSSFSHPPSDETVGISIPFFDKIAHFFIYLFFGFMLFRAIDRSKIHRQNTYMITYISGAFYAFSDEVHQYFVPNRSTDPLDFLADAFAISVSLLIMARMTEKHINEKEDDVVCQSRRT